MEKHQPTTYGSGVTIGVTTSATHGQHPPGLRNPLQLSSMAAGALIFLSGGMSLAQGLGWSDMRVSGLVGHFNYCWFIAVILGTAISFPLGNILPKKFQMAASTLLVLAGGITFVSGPYSLDALVAGRYLNGIGVGLATLPFLCHTSEIARTSSRGACLGLEQFCLTIGIAIQMIYMSQWSVMSTFSPNRLHGILDILLAVAAGGCVFYFIESPVDLIRWGDDAAALDILARLQRPPGITMETNALFEQHKDYVREEQNYSLIECVKRGIFPMVKMIFFRSVILAFTYSLPLNVDLQFSMLINGSTWSPAVAGCLRIIGGCLTLLIVDKFGRKLPSLLWAIVMGGLLIGVANIVNTSYNLLSPHKMSVVTSICLVVQFFAGLFSPNTSAYMGEAFPLHIKPYVMGLCMIAEQIIQIIVIVCASPLGGDGTLMAQGVMIIIAAVCLCVTMPETKNTTLKEAQERFVNIFNFKMF